MSRIKCFECVDGKLNKCDGCNLFEISNNLEECIEALEEKRIIESSPCFDCLSHNCRACIYNRKLPE